MKKVRWLRKPRFDGWSKAKEAFAFRRGTILRSTRTIILLSPGPQVPARQSSSLLQTSSATDLYRTSKQHITKTSLRRSDNVCSCNDIHPTWNGSTGQGASRLPLRIGGVELRYGDFRRVKAVMDDIIHLRNKIQRLRTQKRTNDSEKKDVAKAFGWWSFPLCLKTFPPSSYPISLTTLPILLLSSVATTPRRNGSIP